MTTGPEERDAPNAAGRARDRVDVMRSGLQTSAWWSLWIAAVAVLATAVVWVLAQIWVGVAPVILAVIVSAALWPAVRWLKAHGVRTRRTGPHHGAGRDCVRRCDQPIAKDEPGGSRRGPLPARTRPRRCVTDI